MHRRTGQILGNVFPVPLLPVLRAAPPRFHMLLENTYKRDHLAMLFPVEPCVCRRLVRIPNRKIHLAKWVFNDDFDSQPVYILFLLVVVVYGFVYYLADIGVHWCERPQG